MAPRSQRAPQPHPAPGRLRLIQDLVDTLRIDTGRDALQSPKALRAWLTRHDLLPVDAEIGEDELRSMLAVREALRTVIRGHSGNAISGEAAKSLNEAFGDGHLRMVFTSGDTVRLEPVDGGWTAVLSRLRLIVFEEIAAGRWRRLKICHNTQCGRIFYDKAKNHSGKWCHVRRCGAPVHAKAYRRRGRSRRLTDNLIRG